MKYISLKCPECGGQLEVESDLESFYCKYCGHKIITSNLSGAELLASAYSKRLLHKERLIDKKIELERTRAQIRAEEEERRHRQDKEDMKWVIPLIIVVFLLWIIFIRVIVKN